MKFSLLYIVIKRKETAHYLLKLKSWLENNPDVKVHFGVEIRFVKRDEIWLSPCFQQDSCYINVLMFKYIISYLCVMGSKFLRSQYIVYK